ncbi:hypothetical protein Syun_005105 [Stephania yunnanensis]|uniref:Uncharacterized protein n=1 Tax=Stephania yunnanensis TaxID=152371 RepID=A0AAP0L475_9MAGN
MHQSRNQRGGSRGGFSCGKFKGDGGLMAHLLPRAAPGRQPKGAIINFGNLW